MVPGLDSSGKKKQRFCSVCGRGKTRRVRVTHREPPPVPASTARRHHLNFVLVKIARLVGRQDGRPSCMQAKVVWSGVVAKQRCTACMPHATSE